MRACLRRPPVDRHIETHRRSGGDGEAHDLFERRAHYERLRIDLDRARVEAREVEELLEQAAEALALLDAGAEQLVAHLRRELVAATLERREDAVNGGRRSTQLV